MVMGLDELPRVGGTGAGHYARIAPDVIVAVPRPGYVQDEAGARASLHEFVRIAREIGRKQALVVIVDRVQSQDGTSRRVWQREMDPGTVCCLALVADSLLGRAIASFFVGLRRPSVPTRLFATLDQAVSWCSDRIEVTGGPVS
jgi:hypothetical protein